MENANLLIVFANEEKTEIFLSEGEVSFLVGPNTRPFLRQMVRFKEAREMTSHLAIVSKIVTFKEGDKIMRQITIKKN